MKKKFFVAFLGVLAVCGSVFCLAGQAAVSSIRYFLQPESVVGSDTPYGNNPAVGRYVQSGDAKIYYEVYGEGKPVFVFTGAEWAPPMKWGK